MKHEMLALKLQYTVKHETWRMNCAIYSKLKQESEAWNVYLVWTMKCEQF